MPAAEMDVDEWGAEKRSRALRVAGGKWASRAWEEPCACDARPRGHCCLEVAEMSDEAWLAAKRARRLVMTRPSAVSRRADAGAGGEGERT